MSNSKRRPWAPVIIYAMCGLIIIWRVGDILLPQFKHAYHRRAAQAYLAKVGNQLYHSGSAIQYGEGTDRAVLFTDYECPGCQSQDVILEDLRGSGIAVSYRQLPIASLHPHAIRGARIAICASRNGHFALIHRALMSTTQWKGEVGIHDWLAAQGLPTDSAENVERCFNSAVPDSQIAADRELAARLGINGTPGWVIGDSVHVGVIVPGLPVMTRSAP
jgi:protein-disulfide isomerase